MQTATGATLDAKRILAMAGCVALAVFFWNQPFLLPLKLLVVAMHESGHALASFITGGSVKEIVISADQSGHCLTMDQASFLTRVLTYSGGYVGSAIAGALLILLTFRFRAHRAVLYAMALWLLVLGSSTRATDLPACSVWRARWSSASSRDCCRKARRSC